MGANRRARRRSSLATLVLAIGCAALTTGFEVPVRAAVALTAVAPLGASTGVAVQITGTGFDPVASNNTVTLTPQGGPAINLVAETIATLDAASGLRRLGITLPSGLPIGPAAVLVRNRTTNESAGGRTLQIIQVTLPETNSATRGAQQVAVRITGSANVQFVAGRTTPTFGAGITVASTQVLSPTALIATVSISATTPLGPRTVSVITSTQTALLPAGFTVTSPNRPPTITSTAVTTGAESQPYRYQVVATDPDGDAVSYRLVASPAGMTIAAGLISWTPSASQAGEEDVTVEAMDGRGGTNRQAFRITVAAAPELQAIDVQPSLVRFAVIDTTRPLTVTGLRTSGATIDLTSPATGTTYETNNAFVARVAADGTVTGVANGSATITARNGALSDTAAVVVEAGVTLDALELTPAASTLRSIGATQALALRGRFSDGSFRDLTTAPGTTYESSNSGIAGVNAGGTVTASATGGITVTARHDDRAATASVTVAISGGGGFLRGEAYDDSKGLPLGQVTVRLVSDGGGPLTTPVEVLADERGQFSIAGRAGEAIVRISKPGFTAVERRASIPVDSSTTMFDARLTPVDPRVTLVSSAVGGLARNESGRATLQIPPGGLATDLSVSLTVLGPQGLGALLPAGWSPIAAVAIEPAGFAFGFPLTLTLPNTATLPQGLAVALARYDEATHEWISAGAATIDAGGLTVRAPIDRTGQFVFLVPDSAPFAPAEPALGTVLTGVDRPAGQTTGMTAVGEVVPRSAPPGDDARALGRVGVTTPVPAPSGTFIQARVSEQFDLLDQTQVVTQPFTQDLVSYATPRPGIGGTLGASFPITPSRSFTIQELMIGVVRLDVTPFAGGETASVLGPGGGTIANADGDALQVPAGALASNVPVTLRRVTAADAGITVPAGFDFIAATAIDLVGTSFTAPAQLSTSAIDGLTTQDQILVARAFNDPFGQRRLKVVAVGELSAGRLVAQTTFGTLSLAGIRSGGEFVYLRAQQPTGFVVGTVIRAGGALVAGVLVTSDSASLADVTGADGRYLVAGRTGVDTTLRALDPASRDGVSATVRLDTAGQILTAQLTLGVTGPTVVAVNPASGATGVALDTPVTIDFSEALDVSSVTAATVVLQVAGAGVTADRIVSADARRVIIRPSSPLTALSTVTLQLTAGLRDLSGNPLTGYTPASFTTLDPSRPAQPAPGRIVAELPDESGFVLITGASGVAAGGSAVTVINVRTQETTSVLALADGSFRLRITAIVGDELTLVLRGADGRDATIGITQFQGADGSITAGSAGGTIAGPGERVGTILPCALASAGTFRIDAADATALPLLPAGFAYTDSFSLSVAGASFKTLASLTLSESQNRFAPGTAFTAPFSTDAELTTPPDALVNSSLRFTAVVQDADGSRRTVGAATTIVAGAPDSTGVSTSHTSDFPTLFVAVPREALPGQQVAVSAVAPAARIELETPPPPGALQTDTLLLVQHLATAAGAGLAVIDQLSLVTPAGGSPRARTSGRAFPGMTAAGRYAIVSTHEALVFVTGMVSGAQATVTVDGLPFVFATSGANGRFLVPVRANAAFTLRFMDSNGTVRGTTSAQAPASGTTDVGDPLATTAGLLTVSGDPNERSVVDINAPLVLTFSEPVDAATVASALVVTDDAGSRVFGRLVVNADGASVTFTPSRRWRFGTRYRYGIATSVMARSGARLQSPFGAQFTTFQPSLVGSLALTDARDVSVAGSTAVVATDAGIATIDVASPRAPRLLGQVVVPGGANGVTVRSGAPITDRNGQLHTGPIALVASGAAATGGHLRSFDLTTPASPATLGSTQLTNATGQTPPANVPAFVGTPHSIAVGANGIAFVAIEGVGVSSVQLGQAIPLDTGVPARGGGPRYPIGAESASDVVRLGDRLLVAGVAGLTVLDSATLQRLGGVSTTGNAQGVAALSGFRMDVNGDGAVAAGTEVFDLAVVANGADGTLQFYRVPANGNPLLLSVVRFSGETTDVALDADERLAYVGLGSRGLAIVDLDGPASVQPIDADHNGADDRVLALSATAGSATRVALDLSRGLGYVAEGSGGLSVRQLLPPRTRFVSVRRDPIRVLLGDEQPLSTLTPAATTDEAILIAVDVSTPDDTPVSLVVEQLPAGGLGTLAFEGGAAIAPLAAGLNQLVLHNLPGGSGATVSLSMRAATGQVLARTSFVIVAAPANPSVVALVVAPASLVLSDARPTAALRVGGLLDDGRVLNLTAAPGTTFGTATPSVATVLADGLVTAEGGGTTVIDVSSSGLTQTVPVRVDRAPRLVGLGSRPAFVTLTDLTPVPSGFFSEFSDGERRPAADAPGTAFTTSNPAVATIDATGQLRAVGDGQATLRAANGSFEAALDVSVELGGASTITAVNLTPFAPVTTDVEGITALAQLSGTGALGFHVITFTTSAGESARAVSSREGLASVVLAAPRVPGAIQVTATVTDPSSAAIRTDTETVTVLAGTGDNEPNAADGDAAPFQSGRTVAGVLTSATDARDTFRVTGAMAGTLRVTVTLLDPVAPGSVVIVVRTASGVEISRSPLASLSDSISVDVPAGGALVSLELAGAAGTVRYTLTARLDQGPIVITSVAPATGGAGTQVVIAGSGFSDQAGDTTVLFGAVRGKVTSASPTQIAVVVPVNAIDADLKVISGERSAIGPRFTTGRTVLPLSFSMPSDPASRRYDPLSGAIVDVRRLWVDVDATVDRGRVDALLSPLGGAVVGLITTLNRYLVEFSSNTSLAGMASLRNAVASLAEVTLVTPVSFATVHDNTIDQKKRSGVWNNDSPKSSAFDQVLLFKAIEAVRRTPPFNNPLSLRRVRIAVIDSGLHPVVATEYGSSTHVLAPAVIGPGGWDVIPAGDVLGTHGTAVSSLIAALNDNSPMSGVLGSLYRTTERAVAEAGIDLTVYKCGDSSGKLVVEDCTYRAYEDIIFRNSDATPTNDIDILNLSFGKYDFAAATAATTCSVSPVGSSGGATRCAQYPFFLALRDRTLVLAAAGNEGVQAFNHFPSALESRLPNIISVGAVAVANVDETGELADARAFFDRAIRRGAHPSERSCDPDAPPVAALARTASNCGPGVTLAAPGEDLLTVSGIAPAPAVPAQGPYHFSSGTSGATPIVAGIAAILQAIRPTAVPIPPAELRQILIDTADDISSTWQTAHNESMRRVNALSAVGRVLPASTSQRVYFTEQPETDPIGRVVGLGADPISGDVVTSNALVAPLTYDSGSGVVSGRNPSIILVPTPGDRAYVLAQTDSAAGDGVFVLTTSDLSVQGFVPLNGDTFPTTTSIPRQAVRTSTRTAMVASRSGRLLFVGNGSRVHVIDTVNSRALTDLSSLDWADLTRAPAQGALLVLREVEMRTFIENMPGEIAGLEMSPDDRTLYVLVQDGGGTGYQPGRVLEVDVALDRDLDPSTRYLEPDLSSFFKLKADPPLVRGNDEPSQVVASPDGAHVYVTNGGIQGYVAVIPGVSVPEVELSVYAANMTSTPQITGSVPTQMAGRAGYTQLLSPGLIQAFPVSGGLLSNEAWRFPSEVAVPWTPDRVNISDQFVRSRVNSERPFGLAFRPDGDRALVSFFQTGNFGVLDIRADQSQPRTAPAGVFNGLVAVTPSLDLDAFLVPPADQEPRWFPGRIRYAQNGRFAVAVSKGRRRGALTVIDDNAISFDIGPRLSTPVPEGSGTVPFYRNVPVCAARVTNDTCSEDVLRTLTSYDDGGTDVTIGVPRDVAIQPFVSIEYPGFGNWVRPTSPFNFLWRDPRVSQYRTTVFDLGTSTFPNQAGTEIARRDTPLVLAQRASQSVSRTIGSLFTIAAPPAVGRRYRIRLDVMNDAGHIVSSTTVEVVVTR